MTNTSRFSTCPQDTQGEGADDTELPEVDTTEDKSDPATPLLPVVTDTVPDNKIEDENTEDNDNGVPTDAIPDNKIEDENTEDNDNGVTDTIPDNKIEDENTEDNDNGVPTDTIRDNKIEDENTEDNDNGVDDIVLVPVNDNMSNYEKLKRECQQKGILYEDKDFPATNASIYLRSPWSSPLTEWKRPGDIVTDPKFVVKTSSYVDLEQGELGNCWFVAAAASLAARDWKLLHRVVPQDQTFDKKEGYAGIFRFEFWQYGQWKEVVIDDRLPTRNGRLIFSANTREHNEFWVALLEKAFSKLYGCYEAIDGGRIHDALLDLTGGIAEVVDVKSTSTNRLTEIINDCYIMDTIMGGAIFGSGRREQRRKNGLFEQHAYSIIKVKTVTYRGEKLLLLLLRNPFGKSEWNGPWSDQSNEWAELSPSDRADQATTKLDDGEFWMSVSDFRENFNELELCHLSPESMTAELVVSPRSKTFPEGVRKQWQRTEFTGRWIKGVSAGGPMRSFNSRQFWTNPQYRVRLEETPTMKCSVVVSLLEFTNRLEKNDDDISIGFVIFRLKLGKELPADVRLTEDNYYEHTPQLSDTSGSFWPYRERALHFVLDPGSYVIVPCTFRANQEADFHLRIFSELPAHAGVTEEPVGPTEEMRPITEDMLERLFRKYSGPDGKVDAFDLQKIVTEAKTEEYDKTDGYSLETCRVLISLNDPHVTGLLDLEKVRGVWKNIQLCTRGFHTADTSHDNRVDAFELKEMFKNIGFTLNTETLQCIVRRYGGREGKIHEDDFVQSFCRVLSLYQIFKKKSSNEKMTLTLSEWLSNVLYV